MPEHLLQQPNHLRTPRTDFEDIWGSLETTAVAFGTRDDKEVDSWERSPAGKHVAYSASGHSNTETIELTITAPARGFKVMTAVRGEFMGHADLSAIRQIGFTMHEPKVVETRGLPPVEMLVDLGNDQVITRDLDYRTFQDLCERGGVYEQVPLNRWQRLSHWVTTRLVSRPKGPERDWQ